MTAAPDPALDSWGNPLVAKHFGADADTTCEYGCVKCQSYHQWGDDLFGPHLVHQSKHGYSTRRMTAGERALREFRQAMVED